MFGMGGASMGLCDWGEVGCRGGGVWVRWPAGKKRLSDTAGWGGGKYRWVD